MNLGKGGFRIPGLPAKHRLSGPIQKLTTKMVLRTNLIGKEAVKPSDNNDWSRKTSIKPGLFGKLDPNKNFLLKVLLHISLKNNLFLFL
jgi:hypothetical protein